MNSGSPLKVVFLVRALDYGGAQRQSVTLANALDEDRFDVTVMSFYSSQPLERELAKHVRFVSLAKRGRWDLFSFLRRLIRELRIAQPDVVHGYLDIPNLLALFTKPFVHARVVWGIRAIEIDLRQYDWLLRLAAKLERAFARYADLIIVNSFAGFDHHASHGFPSAKMVAIPNGIDTEIFKPNPGARARLRAEWRIEDQTKLIGTVGRLDPMKNLPGFLQASAVVARQRNEVRFVCVGAGREDYVLKLKALANELEIADLFLWPGARDDMTAVYNALDLLVSSSIGESFPNAVAEAMACGVPCVVTDAGDSGLIVGDCGVVVPPRDDGALASGMLAILKIEGTGAGAKGRMRIIEHYSVAQMARLTTEAIISLGATSK